MNKHIRNLVIIMLLILSVTSVLASEPSVNNITNLEHTTSKELNELMYELTDGIIYKNTNVIRDSIFEQEAKNKMYHFIKDNTIGGSISDIVIDFTYPENSSTEDTVIMVNTRIDYEDGKYNKLYLFEYHVNANGKIYGFNVWCY